MENEQREEPTICRAISRPFLRSFLNIAISRFRSSIVICSRLLLSLNVSETQRARSTEKFQLAVNERAKRPGA